MSTTALPVIGRVAADGVAAHQASRSAPMTPAIWTRYAGALAAALILPPLLGRAGLLNDSRSLTLGVAATFAIAGISLNVLMGYAGQISLGHFALLGTGAFVSARLTAPTTAHPVGLPMFVGVIAAIVASAFVAFLIGLPALRLKGLYLAVVTVVFNYVMVQSIFQAKWFTSGSGGVHLPRPFVGSFEFLRNADYLALMLGALVLVWLVDANLTSSKLGRALQAIRADETMAASFGVDVTRYKLLAFTLSGALAGLAGALYGHLFGAATSDTFDLRQSLLLLTLVVLGGLGSRLGVTMIAAFYGIMNTFVTDVFSTDAAGYIVFFGALALMLTVAFQPEGLAGVWRERREKKHAGSVHGSGEDGVIQRFPDLPRPTGLSERPAAATGGPLLDVRDVHVHFGGLVAVNNASLQVPQGKIVGLIGPNGAGKTTFFNAISGAITPDTGTVTFLGRDLTSVPAHARAAAGIGRTFQLIGLAKDLSVNENLLLAQHQVAGYNDAWGLIGLGPAPRIEAELRDRATEALVALGFARYADTPVKRLSHGQQRIVEIGCALVTAPELIMLDEPSAGMAPGAVENLAVRLRDMRDELGRTVLLIEHNIPLVLDVCDELYVMSDGAIIAHGDPESVVQDAEVVTAYLGGAL